MLSPTKKLTLSQRFKKQGENLLLHVQNNTDLRNGIINYELEDLYHKEISYKDPEVNFQYVFLNLVKRKFILPKNKALPGIIKFDWSRVCNFSPDTLASSGATSSSDSPTFTANMPVKNGAIPKQFPAQISKAMKAAHEGASKPGLARKNSGFPPEPFQGQPSCTNAEPCSIVHIPSFEKVPSQNGFFENSTMAQDNKFSNNFAASKPSKSSRFLMDQRFGFKLNEISIQKAALPILDDYIVCRPCGKTFDRQNELMEHMETDKHLFLEFYHSFRSKQTNVTNRVPKALSGGKKGIQIQSAGGIEGSSELCVNLFLSVEDLFCEIPACKSIQLLVNYTPTQKKPKPLYLDNTFIIFNGSNAATLLEECALKEIVLKGKPIKKTLAVVMKTVEVCECRVVFKFVQGQTSPFFVMKTVIIRADSEATVQENKPEDFEPMAAVGASECTPDIEEFMEPSQRYITMEPELEETADLPLKRKSELIIVNPVRDYALPSSHAKFFNTGFQTNNEISSKVLHKKLALLETLVDGLTEKNYDNFFSLMLHLESHQVLCDLRAYSMKNTALSLDDVYTDLISIMVPGLAEHRPSVLKNDAIYITVRDCGVYKGWVHRVEGSRILVGMGPRFMKLFTNNMKATVDFSFNWNCLNLQHRALEMIMESDQVPQICFPSSFGAYSNNKTITSWVNPLVSKNPQQRQAVQNIVNGTSLPAPYLLFGPPGTGKTVTLVETIKQIFKQSDTTCVLATAPSNSASDLLAERILEYVPASQVLRVYSPSREWSSVPKALHESCNFYAEDCFFPCLEKLMKYRVIVTTLICAGRLVSGGFPEGHFSHIFVDECGHGMEPAALIPVAGLLSRKPNPGQLVLSGDPKQLGPIITSPVARRLGLAQSLLERLMDTCKLYQKRRGHYNPKVLTKLVKNFRSHPDILKVPNELFYDGDLEPCGEKKEIHLACDWAELPTKGVPLIFHGIQGKDAQDKCSPSFYNIAEVDLVVSYVQKILSGKFCGQKLGPADIGIISPYRRQIMKLHLALERKQLTGLSVGSVEEFQGQERRVIIVSTVRSDPAQLSLDRKFRLGFLREPKRFNVALTRAKSLLIVVGNPFTLQMDCNWHRLLEWVIERGGYRGCDFSLSNAPSGGLGPVNLDELRVPVQEKLEQQLALVRQALQRQGSSTNDRMRSTTAVNSLMDDIMYHIQLGQLPDVNDPY